LVPQCAQFVAEAENGRCDLNVGQVGVDPLELMHGVLVLCLVEAVERIDEGERKLEHAVALGGDELALHVELLQVEQDLQIAQHMGLQGDGSGAVAEGASQDLLQLVERMLERCVG